MNISVFIELFLAGITLGLGPCFLFCAPIVSTFIFAKGFDHKEGLKFTLVFSIGRIIAYSILGLVAVAFFNTLGIQKNLFKHIAGVVILLILPIYDLGKDKNPFCNFLHRYINKKTGINTFFIGLLIGLSPCAPLVGILTYIACKSINVYNGFLNGFVFGLGTLFSPLILLGAFSGILAKFFSKSRRASLVFKIIANLFLIYFAVKLLI